MRSAGSYFRAGDVLYGRLRPYLNKVHRAAFEGVASAEFIVFPESPVIDGDFLKFLLHQQAFVDFAMSRVSGDRPRVKFDALAEFEFLLPPHSEQRRIAEKIETLFAEVDKGEESLRQVQALLARYRQSVLKAAVTGELTADWRAQRAGQLEHGRDLLARILKARRENWQGRGKYKEPVEPDTRNLPELPEGWVWASLGQLVSAIEAGKNFRCAERPPEENEVGVVKISAVTWGEFDELESKTITDLSCVDPRLQIRCGDLLISRANTLELVGASVVVGQVSRNLQLSDKVLRLRCVLPVERWVNFVLRSPLGRGQIETMATGAQMSMRNISQENLHKVAIPLPPSSEMRRAVELIDQCFAQEMSLRNMAEEALARSSALRQSILRDAFAGKLVPQDANDEPASELLARIRAQRAAQPGKTTRRKTAA